MEFGIELADNSYVSSLWAFLTLFDFESNFLTFVQSFVAFSLDCTEVNESVSAAVILSDETETFVSVEPLNYTSYFSHERLLKF
ncbi:hypothetical protein AEST_32200 [Alishewanella aestuarii B11]|uniref:Uncharacterized protein n=1 Tax=Alishewanella aestuarii B11 TaxID=1197174 RepID=J2IBH8_9ALTE|nr:hypothetical protein AEST_32200 [Alishewanella aestuarii B11]